ncbi:MAG: hypothetical protein H6716_12690 [Polyangiaceae bacterium]|nr:hypothetical protein [Polyangiaceae bacterium]
MVKAKIVKMIIGIPPNIVPNISMKPAFQPTAPERMGRGGGGGGPLTCFGRGGSNGGGGA